MARRAFVSLGGLCVLALSGAAIIEFAAQDATGAAAADPAVTAVVHTAPVAPRKTATAVDPKPAGPGASRTTRKEDRTSPSASSAGQVAVVAPLAANDRRWAGAAPAADDAAAKPAPQAAKPAPQTAEQTHVAAGPDERGPAVAASPVRKVEARESGPQSPLADDATTGSIPPRVAETVQVAQNEAEVARLEASTGMIEDAGAAPQEVGSQPLPPLKTASVTKYVNLRGGPADEAKVITVVPANAKIEAESGCQWCTVVYNGQRGYIYKTFIRRSLKEAAAEGTGLF